MFSSPLLLIIFSGITLASIQEFFDCNEDKQEILYHYAADYNECFATRVHACDEKAKEGLFTLAQCIHTIAESPKCAALSSPVKRKDGSSNCNSNDESAPKCPHGSVCKGDICCDEKIENAYLLEKFVTSCPPGVKASRENGQILYSHNCTIDFCPHNAECVMGSYFAFCCPPF